MNIEVIQKLSSLFGVSSAEYLLKEKMIKLYESEDIITDRLGSLFVLKKSKNENARTLMIASPFDEAGMMISEVNKDGTLKFIQLESFSLNSLLHQKVAILTKNDEVYEGVVSIKAKVLEDKCEIKSADDLYIDVLLSPEEVKEKIHPGDLVSYAANFKASGNLMCGKALGIRAMNVLCTELYNRIKDEEFDYNIAIGSIAQSTIGNRGTMTATYVVKPDCAIALCGFDDTKLSDGVKLAYYDKGMIPAKRLLNDIKDKCEVKEYFGMIANDGSFIHKTLGGCPSVAMGVSVKNLGSANEIVDVRDIDKLSDVLYAYLHQIDNEKIAYFGFGR